MCSLKFSALVATPHLDTNHTSAEMSSVITQNYFYFGGNMLYNNISIKHHEGAQMRVLLLLL